MKGTKESSCEYERGARAVAKGCEKPSRNFAHKHDNLESMILRDQFLAPVYLCGRMDANFGVRT